jgi:hypothetical protein
MRKVTLTVLALVAVSLPGAPRAEEGAAKAGFPADVEALIFRSGSCNSAATHHDNASTAQLEASRLYLKCDAIANDVAALRQKYQSDPRVLKELEIAELPADADDLIDRRASCDKWAAKGHAHQDRAAGIDSTRAYLKCDAVAKDEAALRQKYIGNPLIVKAFDGKWVIIFKRVPLKIVPQAKPADISKGPSHIIDR